MPADVKKDARGFFNAETGRILMYFSDLFTA